MRGAAAIAGLALLLLAGCEKPLEPPGNPGVCWRLAEAPNGKANFRPFAYEVENLETCAAKLEGAHLVNGQDMVGAYQGRIIYVTRQDVTAAANSKSQRYRVFSPEQRAKVDEGYRTLKARETGS